MKSMGKTLSMQQTESGGHWTYWLLIRGLTQGPIESTQKWTHQDFIPASTICSQNILDTTAEQRIGGSCNVVQKLWDRSYGLDGPGHMYFKNDRYCHVWLHKKTSKCATQVYLLWVNSSQAKSPASLEPTDDTTSLSGIFASTMIKEPILSSFASHPGSTVIYTPLRKQNLWLSAESNSNFLPPT